MFWFTSDEHYGHANVIKYCKRPYRDVEEMDEALIANHNEVVNKNDTVIHAGDFCLSHNKKLINRKYISRLKGNHIFLKGSHDYWLPNSHIRRIERKFDGYFIVIDHYNMRTWARSHYNSWQLYGHSHGDLPPVGKQHDIGVDNNEYYPVSLEQIIEIMKKRPDNFNHHKK